MKLKDILHLEKYKDKHILGLILMDILNFSKIELYTKNNIEIDSDKIKKIEKMYFDYEKNNIPIEYILGHCEFMNENFLVDKNTLIPRPETEYLIKYALKEVNGKEIILDVGTGSGIIGIMLAKLSGKKIIAVDILDKTLNIAKKNAKKLNIDNIIFIQSDLLENVDLSDKNEILICANLPYLEENYKLDNLTEQEPATALFAGSDGLKLYRKLLNQLPKNKKNTCFFELTTKQAYILVKKFNLKNYKILETCHKNIKILKINLL